MEPNSLLWVGSPCGLHGPYIFYKAFRFHLEGKARILSLGDFFLVRCKAGDPICIAELQLLWEERTTKQLLSSSKLYFLPEDTPQGRNVTHGEDEVIAVSEKVIVKLEDLVKWMVADVSSWNKGLQAIPLKPTVLKELGKNGQREALHKYRESTLNSGLNFKDVLKEKAELGEDVEEKKVLVLSYPQYCRYRSIIARLRERPTSFLTDHVVLALGGIASLTNNTQILYCRDTFEHPTLVENESVCDEFAPNLKGRPRKKKLSISQRRDSQGQGGTTRETNGVEGKSLVKIKGDSKSGVSKPRNTSSGSSCKKVSPEDNPKVETGEECRTDEQAFLVALYKYMKERKTPIERIPYLGFKQINLWTMFQAAQKLGGYEVITARRQWKSVYDELGGNPGSTSAATCTRRHYERLILPYERFTKGEEDKPLPPVKARKQEGSAQEGIVKTKMTAMKRPKDEQKPGSEKDASVKVSIHTMLSEVSSQMAAWKEAHSHLSLPKTSQLGTNFAQWQHGMLEYKVPPGALANVEQSRPKEGQNQVGMVLPTLKQEPLTSPEIQPERADPAKKEEACFSFNPLLYPRGNPGIMSPLAKKKMLSQVSGTGLRNNYPYGPPPPLVSRLTGSGAEGSSSGQQSSQAPSAAETNMVIKRPSVIQHAQSFKSRGSEDRRSSTEGSQKEGCNEGEPIPQPQPTLIREPYLLRADLHSSMEKSAEMPRPGQAPSFLSDFYSSPHLHNLSRQTEHHLSKEQISKYLSRDVYPRDCETAQGFPLSQHPDNVGLNYSARLSQKEKGPPAERVTEEQPTDLSLPKSSPLKLPLSTSSFCGIPHPTIQQDIKNSSLFQAGNSQSSSIDYHPRACRVPPMTVSKSKKVTESHSKVLDKAHNGRGEETLGYKIDEMARPILNSKSSPQNICTARPLKRTLEDLENAPSEKKIRAVTPLHCSTQRDGPGKPRTPEADSESMKPAEPTHTAYISSYSSEGHKIPLHSHLFQGLYPGTFVSQVQDMCDSLGSHVTPSYSHPLQYLKNHAVLSPLMPPFAIHSFMMQRQFLATNPTHIYRHQVGTSYGDILHPGFYPMSALHPQPAFSPPQLSSVHPSTKLS
uniref:AT-rich interactive domain-containing protein 5B n=1 Tax=Sinocyclocheilus anshuiensis TaxID=1608454 RepID=A0A671RVM4_9TELE